MDEAFQKSNYFENTLFAALGGICALIVVLHVFFEPRRLESMGRSPASQDFKSPAEEFNADAFRLSF